MLKKINSLFLKPKPPVQDNILQTLKINYIDIAFNDKVFCRSFLNEISGDTLICTIGKMNILENATIQIILYTLCGARYNFLCQIKRREGEKIIGCIQRETVKLMPERRSAVKANTCLRGIVSLDNGPYEAEIKNISTGGVFLSTADELPIGLTFKFSVPSLEITETPLNILRRQSDYSGYGCKFTRLEREYEDVIIRYIFEKQLEERRKFLKTFNP